MTESADERASVERDQAAGAAVVERGEEQNQARRRLFPHALIVGLATGALATAFALVWNKAKSCG